MDRQQKDFFLTMRRGLLQIVGSIESYAGLKLSVRGVKPNSEEQRAELLMGIRRGLITIICAIEDYLNIERSVTPKKSRISGAGNTGSSESDLHDWDRTKETNEDN